MKKGKIVSLNLSRTKGTAKTAVSQARFIEDFGCEGDVHAGPGLRQVSLLAMESIRAQMECSSAREKKVILKPGDFAENVTTEGWDLSSLRIGDRFRLGQDVVLEMSKIGKECHKHCAIYYQLGDCVMPREGVFAKVIKGGHVHAGESLEIEK